MKRIFALLLVGVLLATPVFALQKSLIDQTVANTPVLITSDAIRTADFSKATFFVNYDEVETTGDVAGTFYAEVSWDKDTWFSTKIKTFESSKVDTPDTSITFTSDGKKVAFFDVEVIAPWTRVKFLPSGTATSEGDYIYITVEYLGLN